jgi:surface antigen
MDADRIDRVGLIATHAATGILRRAGTGTVLISELGSTQGAGVEIIALDGVESGGRIAASVSDIEAMRAHSDEFEAYLPGPLPGAAMARMWSGTPPPEPERFGAAWHAYPGQVENGDLWAFNADGGAFSLMVSDGLGHGPLAASASRKALGAFAENPSRSPFDQMARCHDALRDTCGAVLAVAQVSLAQRSVRFAGIGNISAMVVAEEGTAHLMSHNGVIGHSARKVQEFTVEAPDGALLIVHTDGLKSRWNLESYPGLLRTAPAIVCAVLMRDFRRGGDDACIVALRC